MLFVPMSCSQLVVATFSKFLSVRTRMSPTFVLILALSTISSMVNGAEKIGIDLVGSAERIVQNGKY